ncbi:uncharacterized protein LOC118752175 [Rhagoletis pomonella]|uniref:uncharacterized protein LOC118752125 n=1 Tax=Rhagoletis pomonella TaxID=28610 RepID=UPI001783402E|nr:uncharacterized protein LOC118752125 [Rhagoletis pomonella]XP_036342925.1 uncharacterized protein LOC118752175 [Rhagoletis pomonella]
MAYNDLGNSKYLPDLQRAQTKGLDIATEELTEDSSTPNLVILGISMAAFGFLVVNAALVAWFFVHNRKEKGLFYYVNFILFMLFIHLFVWVGFHLPPIFSTTSEWVARN